MEIALRQTNALVLKAGLEISAKFQSVMDKTQQIILFVQEMALVSLQTTVLVSMGLHLVHANCQFVSD